MSFIPQVPIDPHAVIGSLRVTLQNNLHSGERVIDVTLDTISDLTHQSAVFANAGLLSAIELQQSLLTARDYQDAWTALAGHGSRLRESYIKFLDECGACRHRAMDRLSAEDGYAGN